MSSFTQILNFKSKKVFGATCIAILKISTEGASLFSYTKIERYRYMNYVYSLFNLKINFMTAISVFLKDTYLF